MVSRWIWRKTIVIAVGVEGAHCAIEMLLMLMAQPQEVRMVRRQGLALALVLVLDLFRERLQ